MKKHRTLGEEFPDLVPQWHPTKNGTLTPDQVTPWSNKRVWWYQPYDDPATGKHFDFEWESRVCDRTAGAGCPYLSGVKVWSGFNDLSTTHPDLVAQWHPTKNGNLSPDTVSSRSHKRVWWIYSFKNLRTGKLYTFEWQEIIANRVRGKECPYFSKNKVTPGINDIETIRPDLAAQWHPTKNGNLSPDLVAAVSEKMAWWIQPYDDPATGKHFDFEWRAKIRDRVLKNSGCPFLSGNKVWPGFNDLATVCPEIAVQWHPTKNGSLTPAEVSAGSNRKVWWLYPYDDPFSGKHFDFEWRAIVNLRTRKRRCPFLSGKSVWPGFNDLATVCPEIAVQWHPTKNGSLTPAEVSAGSNRKVWWLYPYDDPGTGKHFDFEWQQTVKCRTREASSECPFLSHQKLWRGFNDLATMSPDVAAQWHPTKNGNISPQDVMARSMKIVWWYFSYDDPFSGQHFDFEWFDSVFNRVQNPICPYLINRKVWPGYNDLQNCFPEIATDWHPEKNRTTPDKIMKYSNSYVWWKCKHGHEWRTTVVARTRQGRGCPECYKIRRRYGNWTD